MNVVYSGVPKITLKDKSGKEYELLISSYNTYSDNSIEMTTQIKNTELNRGWVGDLICYMPAGLDICTGDPVDGTDIYEVHCDVLLRSVKIDEAEFREGVTWKYIFLKD